MWVYGGMTDLQERGDLWRWDAVERTWHCIKIKVGPGPLHSHAACKMSSCMVIFGGERNGQTCNDLWKFNFALETWEKVIITGLKPQPRSESVAFVISELLLNGTSTATTEPPRTRSRGCNSADRGNRHSSYLPNNKVGPCEKTYIFQPSQANYNDGSDLKQQYAETNKSSKSFLQEISKLSQLNIPRMSNKCSYTVLTGSAGDSTESLLKQHASPQGEREIIDTEIATPSKGAMVKSKSAYALKKKYIVDLSPTQDDETKETTKKRVEFDSSALKMPRDPISVPNFSILTLPTPVLTPVEATKLVYLDSDEENELLGRYTRKSEETSTSNNNKTNVEKNLSYDNFKTIRKGDSYSSHLGYADNPLYQQMINTLDENSAENISSTSDYASIETVNKLSSTSSYSVKTGTPQDENQKNNKERDKTGPFGFCNPNYMGTGIKMAVNDRKTAVKFLAKDDSKNSEGEEEQQEDVLELQTINGYISKDTQVYFRHFSRVTRPPRSLAIDKNQIQSRPNVDNKFRALSASRVECSHRVELKPDTATGPGLDPQVPLYIYIFGGKEQGQITVFQRPISIWKLKLF